MTFGNFRPVFLLSLLYCNVAQGSNNLDRLKEKFTTAQHNNNNKDLQLPTTCDEFLDYWFSTYFFAPTCTDCLNGGCVWTTDRCMQDCLVADAACYTYECPLPESCEECLYAGFVWTAGRCGYECIADAPCYGERYGTYCPYTAPYTTKDKKLPVDSVLESEPQQQQQQPKPEQQLTKGTVKKSQQQQQQQQVLQSTTPPSTCEDFLDYWYSTYFFEPYCKECQEGGCVFSDGRCRSECVPDAFCYASYCPMPDNCNSCLDQGYVWTGDMCSEECMMDTYCYESILDCP